MTKFLDNKLSNLIISLLITGIFAFRWSDSLPFSDYFPLLIDSDILGVYARYAIFIDEPFSFPIGQIKSLSYPFDIGNISRGSLPLFAIIFKGLNKIFPQVKDLPYFVTLELFFVFVATFYFLLCLNLKGSFNFIFKILASALVVLSPAILFRSSNFYTITFVFAYAPFYLALTYYLLQFYKQRSLRTIIPLILVATFSATIGYYLFMSILIILGTLFLMEGYEYLFRRNTLSLVLVKGFSFSILSTLIFSTFLIYLIGNKGNVEVPPNYDMMTNRYENTAPYGGGLGGGFNVSDIFSPWISPKENSAVHTESLLSRLQYPFTTASNQAGQYEGFSYLGSILAIMSFAFLLSLLRSRDWLAKIFYPSPLTKILIANLATFSLSWGYLIHFFGIKFYGFFPPAFFLGILSPKFMMARAIGRLSLGFTIIFSIFLIFWITPHLKKLSQKALVLICLALIPLHIYDISGFLTSHPSSKGEPLKNTFSSKDILTLNQLAKNKKAIIIGEKLLSSPDWSRICYALTYMTKLPISGANIGFGEPVKIRNYFIEETKVIQKGSLESIFKKYGDIIIAVPKSAAENILKTSDTKINATTLQSKPVVLLTKY